jgi:hypothetical protein
MIVATLLAIIFASVYTEYSTLTTIFDFELGKKSCFRFLWGPLEWVKIAFLIFYFLHR